MKQRETEEITKLEKNIFMKNIRKRYIKKRQKPYNNFSMND